MSKNILGSFFSGSIQQSLSYSQQQQNAIAQQQFGPLVPRTGINIRSLGRLPLSLTNEEENLILELRRTKLYKMVTSSG